MTRTLYPDSVQWDDEWIEKATSAGKKKPPKKLPGDEGVFPAAISTVTSQLQMRQLPQRGMAEMLQAYRSDPWFHKILDIRAQNFASVAWDLFYRPAKSDRSKRVKSMKHMEMRGHTRHKCFTKAVDTGELVKVEENVLLDIFHQPNPVMSGSTFRNLCCRYYDSVGEVFVFKRRDAFGAVFELWPIVPTWVYKLPTETQPYFDISVLGKVMRVDNADMIWMRNHEMLNPYTRGSGSGDALGAYIDTDKYGMQCQSAFFYNNATPQLFIGLPNAGQDTVTDFQNRLENGHRGAERRHRPLIYDSSQEISIKEVDTMKGINASMPLLKDIRDAFISVLGVPPELAGVLTSSNRATIAAAETIFAQHALVPLCEFFLDELSRQLLPDFDDRLLLAYEDPVPANEEKKLEVMKVAPWIASTGEWRELAGLPQRSDEEDNYYMVPTTLVPTKDPSQRLVPLAPHKIGDLEGALDEYVSTIVPGFQSLPPLDDASGVIGSAPKVPKPQSREAKQDPQEPLDDDKQNPGDTSEDPGNQGEPRRPKKGIEAALRSFVAQWEHLGKKKV